MAKLQDHPTSLLLLEGNDDFHVTHALCKQFNVPIRNLENPKGGNFSAIDCNGIEALLEQIEVRFKSSALITTIGVIVDADINLRSRWESLSAIIGKLGFNPPHELPQGGLIASNWKFENWSLDNAK